MYPNRSRRRLSATGRPKRGFPTIRFPTPVGVGLSDGIGCLVGLLLVGFLLWQELERARGTSYPSGDDTITSVISSGEGRVDRYQFLLAVLLDGPVASPAVLREWIVDKGELRNGVKLSHGSPRWSGEVRWLTNSTLQGRPAGEDSEEDARIDRLSLDDISTTVSRTDLPYSLMTVLTSGVNSIGFSFSVGDTRPLQRVATVLGQGPLGLRSSRDTCLLLARPLRVDDQLVEIPSHQARASFGEGLRTTGTLVSIPSQFDGLPSSPMARLGEGSHPLGAMILVLAISLLLRPWFSLIRGCAILVAVWVLVMSGAARVDCGTQVERLRSSSADHRATAVGRLASSVAFAPSAAEALADAYAVEDDPSVRAAIIYALSEGKPIQSLSIVDELMIRADGDVDPIVQGALSIRERRTADENG